MGSVTPGNLLGKVGAAGVSILATMLGSLGAWAGRIAHTRWHGTVRGGSLVRAGCLGRGEGKPGGGGLARYGQGRRRGGKVGAGSARISNAE